jgi:ornithine cyclodeaminase/alanine dehydrogenase-like protein (mu-crystallin family)
MPTPCPWLDQTATHRLLPWTELADALSRILLEKRAGRACAPARLGMALPCGGTLLLMPATDGETVVTKMITVHPENPGIGLDAIQGEVVVMDALTGVWKAILDATAVTARRTAALSLLAARTLAPKTAGPLLLVGAGTQARAHLAAFREGLGVSEVFVVSRTRARAESLCREAESMGMRAQSGDRPKMFLDCCPLVVTATSSRTPVLHGPVRPDCFIAAVGAFTPEVAEIAPELVRSCRVYVDTLEGARSEAGDLLQAEIDFEGVTPLENALDKGNVSDGPVLFKSVGHALFDLAAARLVMTTLP